MKKLLLISVCVFTTLLSFAQNKFTGNWEGALSAGQELKIIFHIKEDADALSATLDVPAQGALGIKCSDVTTDGDKITIGMKMLNGSYEGTLAGNDKIEGKWTQNGTVLPLTLTATEQAEIKHPQTPKPPYTYNSEDIIYYNDDKSIQYGATITTPKDDGKHPSVILISGSGAQNRDEEIFGHKPFAVMADHFTKNGYVVLRIDDRGIGETTGDVKNATSADYAKDVLNGIKYLKSRKEVDKDKIGLLGHSEGGIIAPLVANESNDVDFIILMAGPGVDLVQGMTEQNIAVLEKSGIAKTWAEDYGKLYKSIMQELVTAKSKEEVTKNIHRVINNWKANTDNTVVVNTTGIIDATSQERVADNFIKLYNNPWFRYFIAYEPQPVLRKLDCKVLALNGSEDIQVLPESNLSGIETALNDSKVKTYEVKEIESANHLFQKCIECTVPEYGQLEQTIMPEVLDYITEWMNKHVK